MATRLRNAQREVLCLAYDSAAHRGQADLLLLGEAAGLRLALTILTDTK